MTGAAPIVVPRPDPLTVLVPVWSAFWGVIGAATLDVSKPGATEGIPVWGVYGFFVGLAMTSAWVIVSMALGRLRWQVGGWIALGSWCFVYLTWTVQALGLIRPLVVVSFLMTICVASYWQARRLNAWLSQPKG